MKVDLHIHTTCSDGLRTPQQTVVEACKKAMKAIAITDHDMTSGVELALQAAEGTDVEIIPGVEINSFFAGQELHILGYYIDTQNSTLQRTLLQVREARKERARNIVKKLQQLGFRITVEEVADMAGTGGAWARPHIARILIRKGYFRSMQEVFERLLDAGGKAYVERYRLSASEAIELIRQAGGIPVLAHPGIYKLPIDWRRLVELGIAGVEVYHSKHDMRETKHYLKLAEQYQLLVTGGSDCHGIGTSSMMGTVDVPPEVVKHLKARYIT